MIDLLKLLTPFYIAFLFLNVFIYAFNKEIIQQQFDFTDAFSFEFTCAELCFFR